jgi:hypothetical protein
VHSPNLVLTDRDAFAATLRKMNLEVLMKPGVVMSLEVVIGFGLVFVTNLGFAIDLEALRSLKVVIQSGVVMSLEVVIGFGLVFVTDLGFAIDLEAMRSLKVVIKPVAVLSQGILCSV